MDHSLFLFSFKFRTYMIYFWKITIRAKKKKKNILTKDFRYKTYSSKNNSCSFVIFKRGFEIRGNWQ